MKTFTGEHKTMKTRDCNDKFCNRPEHYALTASLSVPVPTPEADYIHITCDGSTPVDDLLKRHLPEVIALFRQKAKDYSADNMFTADLLGSRGQFGDLWRKIPKLYKGLWLREKLNGEQPAEILADFIGHCFLALGFLDDEEDLKPKPGSSSPETPAPFFPPGFGTFFSE